MLENFVVRLKDLMEQRHTNPSLLSRQIGREENYIDDFLRGKRDAIAPKEVKALEYALHLNAGELRRLLAEEPPPLKARQEVPADEPASVAKVARDKEAGRHDDSFPSLSITTLGPKKARITLEGDFSLEVAQKIFDLVAQAQN